MKKMIIGWLIDNAFDLIVIELQKLAGKTSTSVDDEMVRVIKSNRGEIIRGIKSSL